MANIIQKATQAAETTAVSPRKSMGAYIERMKGEIARALPSVMTPERFTRITLSALSSNPKLATCTQQSFLGAMMTAAQLGLEPNTPLGQAYLIPYRNHGTMECQFQIGYHGIIDLAYRSGQISTIQAHVVHENDEFSYSYGLDPELRHVPAKGNRGAATHVYATFRTKDGGFGYEVMSLDEVREFAQKKSKSYSSGPWQTDFEAMAKKTVLKKVLKYAPLSSDFVRGMTQDGSVKTEIDEDMSLVPDTIEVEEYTVDEATGEAVQTGEQGK